MTQDDPKFMARLPRELNDALSEAARVADRSKNAELIFRLRQTFGADFVPPPAPPVQRTAPGRRLTEEQIHEVAMAAAHTEQGSVGATGAAVTTAYLAARKALSAPLEE